MAAGHQGPIDPNELLRAQVRWRLLETVFWLATLLPFFAVADLSRAVQPDRHRGAVRALARLDCRLQRPGFARTCRFFRIWRLYRGTAFKARMGRTDFRSLRSPAVAAMLLGYLTSFIIVRISHFALIMVTLGLCLLLFELANQAA